MSKHWYLTANGIIRPTDDGKRVMQAANDRRLAPIIERVIALANERRFAGIAAEYSADTLYGLTQAANRINPEMGRAMQAVSRAVDAHCEAERAAHALCLSVYLIGPHRDEIMYL